MSMRFFKQLGMALSASGSVNAKWMPSIPTGFGSGSVVGIGGYHTESQYSVMKKVLEANLKGGVVHECSYHPLKRRGIYVVPCFEIPKVEEEEEVEILDMWIRIYIASTSAIEALLPPISHKLISKVERANFMRFNKKGAVLHAYEFSWREGVKLTPILNLSGTAWFYFKFNPFLFTFKATPIYHE